MEKASSHFMPSAEECGPGTEPPPEDLEATPGAMGHAAAVAGEPLEEEALEEESLEEEPLEEEETLQRYGKLLCAQGLSEKDWLRVWRLRTQTGQGISLLLSRLELSADEVIAGCWGELLDIPVLGAEELSEATPLELAVSCKFLRHAGILPVELATGEPVLAMVEPADENSLRALTLACGSLPQRVAAAPGALFELLDRRYAGDGVATVETERDAGEESPDEIARLHQLAQEAPVVRIVHQMIQQAVRDRASDIHLEPFEKRLALRYRVDGVLREVESPPARDTAAIVSRIKIMARLNIAERRLPQDGRIPLKTSGRDIDLRVSTVPTHHGESVVLRILDKKRVPLDFAALGFDGETGDGFLEALNRPHGILLVTGPTGSGKSTTLYAALQRLNTPERKILTVEDPVEYQLAGINQIQVKPSIGLSFASALRSIVRQDPDILMIGEMRDLETASIAVQSALTGHLVFSTLHTNDAPGAVTRMLDMGVEDYLINSSVLGILAQRLVRVLCPECRRPRRPRSEDLEKLENAVGSGVEPLLCAAVGCDACEQSGYQGRTVICEYLPMSDPVRRLIQERCDEATLRHTAREADLHSMRAHGILKAAQGITTLEEVLRVTHHD